MASKVYYVKVLRVSKVLGRQVSKAEGDPGLTMRSEVFRSSLKVDGLKISLIQGFRAPRVIGFQDMWGYIFDISPGHRISLAGWGFREVWRFQNPRVSGN